MAEKKPNIEEFDPIFHTRSLADIFKNQGFSEVAMQLSEQIRRKKLKHRTTILERLILERILTRLHS